MNHAGRVHDIRPIHLRSILTFPEAVLPPAVPPTMNRMDTP